MMNLASVNFAPKAPADPASGKASLAASETGQPAQDFANTLKGQENYRKEPKDLTKQDEPVHADAATSKGIAQEGQDKVENHEDDLTALLEKFLPPANAEPAPEAVSVGMATLPAADAPIPGLPNINPLPLTGNVIAQDNSLETPVLDGIKMAKPASLPVEPTLVRGNGAGNTIPTQKNPALALAFQAGEGDTPLPSIGQANTFESALAANLTNQNKAAPEIMTATAVQRPVEAKPEIALAIPRPMAHPAWSKDLGEQVLWLHNKDISAAEIKLNPLHLGPISVRIDINQDNQTSIMFTAQHAETKEALEASLPKLREMLNGQQINLANVNISQHSNPHQGRQPALAFQGQSGTAGANPDNGAQLSDNGELGQVVGSGLLNLYA